MALSDSFAARIGGVEEIGLESVLALTSAQFHIGSFVVCLMNFIDLSENGVAVLRNARL